LPFLDGNVIQNHSLLEISSISFVSYLIPFGQTSI